MWYGQRVKHWPYQPFFSWQAQRLMIWCAGKPPAIDAGGSIPCLMGKVKRLGAFLVNDRTFGGARQGQGPSGPWPCLRLMPATAQRGGLP